MTIDNELLELTKKLLRFPSVTPNQSGCIDYIAELLNQHGFKVQIKEFGASKVANLYASFQGPAAENSPNICFAGHIDVVPPGGEWQYDPFEAKEVAGKIYGRGAVDMKGALSAMLLAALRFTKTSKIWTGKISFLITADEEGDAEFGTKKMLELLERQGEKLDFVIIGEPSSDQQVGDIIKTGSRGSFHGRIEVIGKQGHVAFPHLSQNPITYLVKILNEMVNLKLDDGNENFIPSNLEILSIDVGNLVCNLIPKVAKANFNIRFNNQHNAASLEQQIQQIIAKYPVICNLDCQLSGEAYFVANNPYITLMQEVIKSELGINAKCSTAGGTSDARFIKDYAPVCELGLPAAMAHKIDEFVENSDLQAIYNVYYMILERIFFIK